MGHECSLHWIHGSRVCPGEGGTLHLLGWGQSKETKRVLALRGMRAETLVLPVCWALCWAFTKSSFLVLLLTLWGGNYYYCCFTDGQTGATYLLRVTKLQ